MWQHPVPGQEAVGVLQQPPDLSLGSVPPPNPSLDASAAVNPFRSPRLHIAPLDTTVHLHKLHAPDPAGPSWTLDTRVASDNRSESPPRRATSSATTVTLELPKAQEDLVVVPARQETSKARAATSGSALLPPALHSRCQC